MSNHHVQVLQDTPHAKQEISALIEVPPGRLQDYTPHLKYLLLDEGAIIESAPLAL